MPISGSDKAPLYAQFGVMRFGATRFGYHSPKVCVSVGGVQRAHGKATAAHKLEDLSITETTSSTPNRASFKARGWEPTTGMEVIVTLGSINRIKRLFAGTVLSVVEANVGSPDARVIDVQVVDWTWSLNRTPVLGHYTGTADEIALELMDEYAPDGFTTNHVESGLATVDGGITFTNVDLSSALSQLAKRVGAKTYIDYSKDLYFRVTDLAHLTNPVTLVEGLSTLRRFSIDRDFSQMFTSVSMEGGGSSAAADVVAGEPIIPLLVAPAGWYGDVGGVVLSGPQKIAYTARFEGGGGSLVGPGVGPSSAPALALAAGSGVTSGDHALAVVFRTAGGQSLPGPRATIAVGSVAAPTAGPTAGSPDFGVGPDPGNHYYALTNVTDAGETTASPVSGTVTTAAGAADPSLAVGTPTVPAVHIGFESLTPGHVYTYKQTWGDAHGNETLPSPASGSATVGASKRLRPVVRYSTDARITRVYLYRSADGGGAPWTRVHMFVPDSASPAEFFVNSTAGGTQAFDDSDGALLASAAPTANTTGLRVVPLADLQLPTDALVTSRKLYGTAAGDAQLKLIATLNTTDTTYNVTTLDADLGTNIPTSNTAVANQIGLSDIPIGTGPVTVTQREIFMTAADDTDGTMRLALTIANNVDTTGTVTISDATLAGAAAAPTSDASGLTPEDGQVVAGSTSIPVAGYGGENGFSRDGGWAIIGNGQVVVRYAARHEGSLVGIPSSGPGSITSAITYGSQITAAPALIDCGIAMEEQRVLTKFNVSRPLRLATATATDRLGMIINTESSVDTDRIRLRLSRVGTVTGNIWITIQQTDIGPSATVLATSALVDASIIGTEQIVTFTHDVLPPDGIARWIVLHGDYTRSDTDYIEWHGSGGVGIPSGNAKQYDGTTISNATGITFGFRYQVLSSAGALPILYTIPKGQDVNCFVTADDAAAQAVFASLLDDGSDGIKAKVLQDRRLSRAEALARAEAYLSLRKDPRDTINYVTKDMNTSRGKQIAVALVDPTNVNDTFAIQSVTIRNFTPNIPPDYTAQASDELVSIEDLLNREP